MSHFFTIVIVPADTKSEEIEAKVQDLLAPYDENLDVTPYKKYLDNEDISRMASFYESDDLSVLAARMEDWSGGEGGIDEQGLYELSTRNTQSKWDWWTIGGRWNGVIRDTPRSDEKGFNFAEEYRQLDENILPVWRVDHKIHAHAVITPDGKWHEQGRMGWFAVVHDEKAEEVWDAEVVKIIQDHRDCLLVGVDCHI